MKFGLAWTEVKLKAAHLVGAVSVTPISNWAIPCFQCRKFPFRIDVISQFQSLFRFATIPLCWYHSDWVVVASIKRFQFLVLVHYLDFKEVDMAHVNVQWHLGMVMLFKSPDSMLRDWFSNWCTLILNIFLKTKLIELHIRDAELSENFPRISSVVVWLFFLFRVYLFAL